MKKLTEFLNHERYQVVAFVITVALTIWLTACPSKVPSLVTPPKLVTRAELKIELDTLLASAEARFHALDRQDELKEALFEQSIAWAQTGVINPLGIITTMCAIAGIGATVDNVRKRRKIKGLETNANSTAKTDPPAG